MIAFKILLIVFLGTSDLDYYLAATVLGIIGCAAMLRKSGLPWWYALIPCWRSYSLARCADREPEGRVLFAAELFSTLLGIGNLLLTDKVNSMLPVIALIIILINAVYTIRVISGLHEVYGRKNGFFRTLVWIFMDWIPMLLWGFGKKYQPRWSVKEIEGESSTYFSGAHVDALADGLTVNLEERTARDFFKTKYLLRDIHMYIKPGSMVLLLGGSGAGKTTLLNAINGYEPAKAEVTLNGGNVYKQYDKMKYEVGFVPQQDLMREDDTVLKTLTDAAALRLPQDFSKAERRARVDDVMKIFGLTPVQSSLVVKLSGGQRKRLSIAMEFISNPSLFILDEPDSGLDGVMARELMTQLRAIADQGKIVLVITHTPDRVIDLFDDVIVLAKDGARTGRLAYYGPIAEAREFFGRDSMEQIVRSINRTEEGGEGRADEFIQKFVEVQHG